MKYYEFNERILEESVTSQFFLWKTFRTLWQVTEGPKALRIRDEEGRLQ